MYKNNFNVFVYLFLLQAIKSKKLEKQSEEKRKSLESKINSLKNAQTLTFGSIDESRNKVNGIKNVLEEMDESQGDLNRSNEVKILKKQLELMQQENARLKKKQDDKVKVSRSLNTRSKSKAKKKLILGN